MCRTLSYIFICFLLFFTPGYRLLAQQNVWNQPKEQSRKLSKKADNGKKKIKDWKNHVKQWGLDDKLEHQLSLGGKLNNNGWSGAIYYFNNNEGNTRDVYILSFSEIKHEKQVKLEEKNLYPELDTPSPFVYGKINNLYTVQLGWGKEYMLLPQVIEGNVSVGVRWNAGFSLAMLKPYYLRLIYVDNTLTPPVAELKEENYSMAGNETFLRSGNKLGASLWTKGLGEMKYVPGAYLECVATVEPGSKAWFVQTITLGGNLAYYSQKLPIMAEVKSSPLQASLFIGLALGKRW